MRTFRHRFLSCLLLATYAGISLLGDGLHLLLPEGKQHHHHHGIDVAGYHCHDAGHHHGHGDCCPEDIGPAVSEADGEGHLCEICSFLVHAVAQPAEVATAIEWQPFVVESEPDSQAIYWCISLGPQAPRGPPLLVG